MKFLEYHKIDSISHYAPGVFANNLVSSETFSIYHVGPMRITDTRLKTRPNDRNMPTQHIATLLGATCCARLATVLRCVATCGVSLAQI